MRFGFHFLDFKTGDCTLIVDPEPDKPTTRLNDGKVDKRGRFVAGSMDTMEEGPNGSLYRLDPDLSLHKLDQGIVVSNGPCWSPDGKILYFADSWSGEIWAYDYDLDTLFVTSMAKPPLPRFPSDGVLRGSLFAIHDLGVRGVPEPRFAG